MSNQDQSHTKRFKFADPAMEALEKAAEAAKSKAELPKQKEPVNGGSLLDSPQFMEEMAQKLGLKVMSEEDIKATMEETKRLRQEELKEAEKARRASEWDHLCPAEFREPWNWSKCKAPRVEVEKVLNWKWGKRGIYLLGHSGHCKTRAVYKLLERLFFKECRKIVVMGGTQFANEAARAFMNVDTTEGWLNRMARHELLFIDDLGKRWTRTTGEAAFDIIDRRTSNHRPTIITSNYDAEELQSMSKGGPEAAADLSTFTFRRIIDYFDLPKF